MGVLEIFDFKNKFVRGEYLIEIVDSKTGLVKDSRKGENLWLNQGSRFFAEDTSAPTIYVCLSNTAAEPTYTDISIPAVFIAAAGTRKFQDGGRLYKRHQFVASFSPPASDRKITALGLAKASTGTDAYCWTKLLVPIVQTPADTLYVYYYVYVLFPDTVGWVDEFTEFSRSIFGYPAAIVFNKAYCGDVKTDVNGSELSWVSISGASNSSTKYKKFWWGNIGSSGSLGTHLGLHSGIAFTHSASTSLRMIMRLYPGDFLGRVWAKAKTSTVDFFDSANLPTGWGRGVEVRPAGGVYPYETRLRGATAGKLTVLIESSGAVGTARYRLRYEYLTGNKRIMNNVEYVRSSIFEIYGRKFCLSGTTNNARLTEIETGGGLILSGFSVTGMPLRFVTVRNNNELWVVFNNASSSVHWINNIAKIVFTNPNDLREYTITEYVLDSTSGTTNGVRIGFVANDGKFYYTNSLSADAGKLKRFDFVTGEISDTWIDGVGGKSIDNAAPFGCYDYEKNEVVIKGVNGSLRRFSLAGNDISGFTGVADFSGNVIQDWWNLWDGGTRGRITQPGDGRLYLRTSTGNISGTTWTPCVINQRITSRVFEATMSIENFDPTVNFQELGLYVRGLHSALSHKRIGKVYNGAKRIEVLSNTGGGANVTEGGIAFTPVAVRFRITRDSANVVRCHYSTSPLSVPDESATWTLLGNETYTLTDENVEVGIYAITRGGTTQLTGSVNSFRINTGTVDRRVNTVNSIQADVNIGRGRVAFTHFENGLVAVGNGGYYVCVDDTATSPLFVYKLRKTDYRILVASGDIAPGSRLQQELAVYRWDDGINDSLVGQFNDTEGRINYSTSLKFISVDSGETWFKYTMDGNAIVLPVEKYEWLGGTGWNLQFMIIPMTFGWDGSKWVVGHAGSRLTHSEWVKVPVGNFDVRFLNNPSNPGATFSSLDKYEAWFGNKCIIKDNQQYLTGVGLAAYYCNVQRAQEVYTNVPASWTLNSRLNNTALWLTTDFDWLWKFYFKTGAGVDDYAYWIDIITENIVDGVVNRREFTTSNVNVSWVYGYYRDMYVEFTSGSNAGVRRKIVEYDGYNKRFVVASDFPHTIKVGDTFKIVNPALASRVTTITGVNQFAVVESTGTVSVHSNDVGKNVEIEYLFLLRSW